MAAARPSSAACTVELNGSNAKLPQNEAPTPVEKTGNSNMWSAFSSVTGDATVTTLQRTTARTPDFDWHRIGDLRV